MLKNGLKWGVFGVKMGVFLLFYSGFILKITIKKYGKFRNTFLNKNKKYTQLLEKD
jgi:hypothetical protein